MSTSDFSDSSYLGLLNSGLMTSCHYLTNYSAQKPSWQTFFLTVDATSVNLYVANAETTPTYHLVLNPGAVFEVGARSAPAPAPAPPTTFGATMRTTNKGSWEFICFPTSRSRDMFVELVATLTNCDVTPCHNAFIMLPEVAASAALNSSSSEQTTSAHRQVMSLVRGIGSSVRRRMTVTTPDYVPENNFGSPPEVSFGGEGCEGCVCGLADARAVDPTDSVMYRVYAANKDRKMTEMTHRKRFESSLEGNDDFCAVTEVSSSHYVVRGTTSILSDHCELQPNQCYCDGQAGCNSRGRCACGGLCTCDACRAITAVVASAPPWQPPTPFTVVVPNDIGVTFMSNAENRECWCWNGSEVRRLAGTVLPPPPPPPPRAAVQISQKNEIAAAKRKRFGLF